MKRQSKYNIYHLDREYAKEVGDPLLGVVMAHSLEEAKDKARKLELNTPTGIHVVLAAFVDKKKEV